LYDVDIVTWSDWEGWGDTEACYWLQEGPVFPRQEDDDVCHYAECQ